MTQEFSGKDPKSVQKVTSIGAGPIGAGWSAYFLSQGYKVSVYLHEASEKDVLLNLINTAWISLEALGLAEGASRDNLYCSTDLADAVNGSDSFRKVCRKILLLSKRFMHNLVNLFQKMLLSHPALRACP